MLWDNKQGVVVQVSQYPRKKGEGKSKSFIVLDEDVDVCVSRIKTLYHELGKLEKEESVKIKHYR